MDIARFANISTKTRCIIPKIQSGIFVRAFNFVGADIIRPHQKTPSLLFEEPRTADIIRPHREMQKLFFEVPRVTDCICPHDMQHII